MFMVWSFSYNRVWKTKVWSKLHLLLRAAVSVSAATRGNQITRDVTIFHPIVMLFDLD